MSRDRLFQLSVKFFQIVQATHNESDVYAVADYISRLDLRRIRERQHLICNNEATGPLVVKLNDSVCWSWLQPN
jgi:hypothetical protein